MQNLFRRLTFNLWYFRKPPWDSGVSPPELFEFIQTHPAGKAIDIGCGTGTNVVTLAKTGWDVTGVDFAPRAIKLAKRKLKQSGVQANLLVGDATKLNGITGPFDLALDLGCFHGIAKDGRAHYLNQLDRILAPNGFWLLYAFIAPINPPAAQFDSFTTPPKLAEADISLITPRFLLRSRRDGFDAKRNRSSSWFLFQKTGKT
jgi:ubiquinone/menaquinone biosynthesis C-methylase UbiE